MGHTVWPFFCVFESTSTLLFLDLKLAWISAKFCVCAKHRQFRSRVSIPQGIQKSYSKFPKMTIGCPRIPKRAEIGNLRIFYKLTKLLKDWYLE